MKTKLVMIVMFLIGATISYGQITNTGYGVAGTGVTGSQPYNINMVVQDRYDGDRHPLLYITVNSHLWPVMAPQKLAFCKLMNWDAVQGRWVQLGCINAHSTDGAMVLGGTIFVNAKTWKVIAFKAIDFYTPSKAPTVVTSQLITIFVWDTSLGAFVRRRDLDIGTIYDPAFMSGTVYLNPQYQIVGGTFDGKPIEMGTAILIPVPYVPAPSGPTMPIMPAKVK